MKQRILAAHADEQNWYRQTENFALSSFYELEPDPVNEAEISNLEIADWMQKAYASSALALPLLPDKQLNLLFRKHAPKFHIDLLQDNDKLGAPHWQQNQIAVDTENPHIYTIASMTRFADTKLLQLNYVAWFPERRPTAPIDLYAGKIDSIIWRVTLNKDGEVLLYDSIHSCGCYHKYFPVSQQLLVRTSPTAREPANIFPLSHSIAERGVTLTITSNEHYIVGVSSTIPAANSQQQLQTSRYRFQPYHSLYNLQHNFQSNSPNPSASKSLFDADGIISASKRLERFTLWPTGIRSVGAMRQWGTHSTGFIEQQHFDDANLLENYFQLSP